MDDTQQQATGRRRRNTDPATKRDHTVSVRVNGDELAWIDQRRGGYRRGEWLRRAAFGRRLPGGVPELNRDAWQQLARLVSNLNQHQRAINEGAISASVTPEHLEEIREAVQQLRSDLIGQGGADDEG